MGGGAVAVLHGSHASGLTANDDFFDLFFIGPSGSAANRVGIGSILTAGDFNGDGRADLAIGAPFENVGTIADAGTVFVVYGSQSGLSTTGRAPQSWHQNTAGIEDAAETGDHFGSSLTAWNFGQNQTLPGKPGGPPPRLVVTADLAIGVPLENIGTITDAGGVNVIYGSASGLSSANDQLWHQDSPGIPGGPETQDHFGAALY